MDISLLEFVWSLLKLELMWCETLFLFVHLKPAAEYITFGILYPLLYKIL